jgi:HPt (histidine-containing phosphotransfer) domain-containing protein
MINSVNTKSCTASDLWSACLQEQALESIKTLERNGSPGLVGIIVDSFVQSSDELIAHIEQFDFTSKEKTPLLHAVHTLKSSAGNVGAIGFADKCAEVESLLRAGRAEGLELLCQAIVADYVLVKQALHQWYAACRSESASA